MLGVTRSGVRGWASAISTSLSALLLDCCDCDDLGAFAVSPALDEKESFCCFLGSGVAAAFPPKNFL